MFSIVSNNCHYFADRCRHSILFIKAHCTLHLLFAEGEISSVSPTVTLPGAVQSYQFDIHCYPKLVFVSVWLEKKCSNGKTTVHPCKSISQSISVSISVPLCVSAFLFPPPTRCYLHLCHMLFLSSHCWQSSPRWRTSNIEVWLRTHPGIVKKWYSCTCARTFTDFQENLSSPDVSFVMESEGDEIVQYCEFTSISL